MLRSILHKSQPFVAYRFYSTSRSAKQITSSQLTEWMNQKKLYSDMIIVDVRERSEIEEKGKIKGALNIPFSLSAELFKGALSEFNKETPIIFHCRGGRRSDEAALMAEKLGYKDCYSLVGGIEAWQGPVQAFMNNHSPWVHTILEKETETAQYVVTDFATKEAYIIDPVLDYDPFASKVHTATADNLLKFIESYELNVTKIIETHVHAPEVCIGANVTKVQKVFGERYNLGLDELSPTGEQFDVLTSDGMQWTLGKDIHCSVISTPGHTPACMSYRLGDAAFVGDTLFMPDIGTARCDFPGGSVKDMYESIHKMYSQWPDDTRIYVGHDYPGSHRSYEFMTLLQQHKKSNKMINENVSLEEYSKMRQERDKSLRAPRYIHPSIQTNLRGGVLPTPEVSIHDKKTLYQFFKIPIRWDK
ncbi:Metallo-hydrolase/oxidoreductase [Rhizopus microsporus]|uniref:Metallo-hydrolase/oxidoreductase n=1 Tax=Rhizopus microsporus TaxID=58291 RepID=A0A1X0SDU3_RHIZD|nr:Metallo-hydrolase/oxidoreductase [Rhizopus microsporus]